MEGILSIYFLCGNANKIYLEALYDVIPLLFDGNSRICLWPELSVEYVCPESFREKGIDGDFFLFWL